MQNQAAIIGGGIAGLTAAKVLSEHYETVTVFEPYLNYDFKNPRRSALHAVHLHVNTFLQKALNNKKMHRDFIEVIHMIKHPFGLFSFGTAIETIVQKVQISALQKNLEFLRSFNNFHYVAFVLQRIPIDRFLFLSK